MAVAVDTSISTYPSQNVMQDVGPYINFKRKGLHTLLGQVHDSLVCTVVNLHKDQLYRFVTGSWSTSLVRLAFELMVH